MKNLLGLEVPDDARGCLQDIHWAMGSFGYFPSYALGNLYAAQFWSTMKAEMPDMEKKIGEGNCSMALAWLRRNIHKPGSACLPGELLEKITGSPLDASHFTRYLEGKYSEIYGF